MEPVQTKFAIGSGRGKKLLVDMEYETKDGERFTFSVHVPNANWTVSELQEQALSRLAWLVGRAQLVLKTSTRIPPPEAPAPKG